LLLLVLYRFEFKKYQPEQFAFDDEGVHLKYHNREMPVLIPWTEIKSVETSRLIMCFYIYKNPNYKYRISLGPEVSKFIDLSTKLETRHKYRIPLGPEVSDFDDLFSEVEKYRDNYHFEID
jgi:hypothetical protein